MTSLPILLGAGLVSLFVAWAIGAGSSGSTPFAPAVGADSISIFRAVVFAGALSFVGALVQGGAVTETVGTGLVDGVSSSPLLGFVSLATAGVFVAAGVLTGYPISTAFSVSGAVTGAGVALGGTVNWEIYRSILLTWTLAPVAVGLIAYLTAEALWHFEEPNSLPVLAGVLGALLPHLRVGFLGDGGASVAAATPTLAWSPVPAGVLLSLAVAVALATVVRFDSVNHPKRSEDRFLVGLGCLVAFSAGGSQVAFAIGPLLPLLEGSIPLRWVLAAGGLGLVAGTWTGAPRMIRAMGTEYAELGAYRSIAALLPAFVLTQSAVLFGIPISFTQAIVSAISGSGYVAGVASVSERKLGITALGWVGSFVGAFAVGFGVFAVMG
jgi:PiT family inorganic phosphate transporter